jgi:hypothetical protein
MRYNKNHDEIRNDFIPLLKYFDEVAKKYSNDDKDHEKIRGAALYNQARINQYIDNHTKVIELCDQLKLNGKKNEKAAVKFVEESNLLIQKLAFHKMQGRYIIPDVVSDADDLGEKSEDSDDDDN